MHPKPHPSPSKVACLDAQVVAAELVARTCVPPQAVLANAEADSFALAASPVQTPVAMGGAGAPAAGAADSAADMEEDTVSPRTLQQVSFLYSPYYALLQVVCMPALLTAQPPLIKPTRTRCSVCSHRPLPLYCHLNAPSQRAADGLAAEGAAVPPLMLRQVRSFTIRASRCRPRFCKC